MNDLIQGYATLRSNVNISRWKNQPAQKPLKKGLTPEQRETFSLLLNEAYQSDSWKWLRSDIEAIASVNGIELK